MATRTTAESSGGAILLCVVHFVIGSHGTVLTSSHGADFTARDAETARDLEAVACGDDLFVVVGSGTVIRNSDNGLDWF